MKLKNNKPSLKYLSSLKAALLLCIDEDERIVINKLIDKNLSLIKDVEFNYDTDELISYTKYELKTMGVASQNLISKSLELAIAQCGYDPSNEQLIDFFYTDVFVIYEFDGLIDEYKRKRKFIYSNSTPEILKAVVESFDAYYISILSKIYRNLLNTYVKKCFVHMEWAKVI